MRVCHARWLQSVSEKQDRSSFRPFFLLRGEGEGDGPMGGPLRRWCAWHFSAIRGVLWCLFFSFGGGMGAAVQFDSDYSGGDGASSFF